MTGPARPAAAGRRGGFTLLELLVAITLLGLIMTMAFSGLRLGTRAWEAADEREHDVYLVQQLLRTRLGAAYLSPEFGATWQSETGEEEPLFDGGPDYVSFVAPLPELFGVGGLYRVTVEAVDEGGGRLALVMSWRLLRVGADVAAALDAGAEERDRRVLLDGLEGVEFAFLGPDENTGEAVWRDGWREQPTLPTLIRLVAEHPDEPWPPLVVAPRMAADTVFESQRP
ncbi:MAG TPA: prepilin-type N-terminal cleavage/methylation domain-containing protein [Geminicoccaceae bacterium]|nr:prepilin-type N-terminal cleavage/methylation domain-containing protein [Geminicoccaceae bacterium]